MFYVWRDFNKLTVTEEASFNQKHAHKIEAECLTLSDANRFVELERGLTRYLYYIENMSKPLAMRH